MSTRARWSCRALAWLAALALCSETLAVASERPRPLDSPAPRSVRPAGNVLLAVALAGRRVVAVGERGTVVLSDDSGRTWRQARATPVSVALTAVQFASPRSGWALGHMGVVLRTEDGGETWTRRLDGVEAARLALVAARSGGANARRLQSAQRLVSDGPDKPFLDLLPDGPASALVVGAYGLAFLTDDGRSWRPALDRFENPGGLHIYGLARQEGLTYAAGEQGLFLRSVAGGPFKKLATPYPGTFFGVVPLAQRSVLVFGLRGTILRSDDAGAHWRVVPTGTTASLTSGRVLSDGRVVLASLSGRLLVSHDGGRSFTEGPAASEPVAGFVQAPDGALIVVGPRGAQRIAFTGARP